MLCCVVLCLAFCAVQLFSLVASLKLPMARWWWMLPGADAQLARTVGRRASGKAPVYSPPKFTSNSSSRADRHTAADGSSSSSSDSGDDAKRRNAEQQRLEKQNCWFRKHRGGVRLAPNTHSSSEDEAAAWDAAENFKTATGALEELQEVLGRLPTGSAGFEDEADPYDHGLMQEQMQMLHYCR